MIPDGLLLLAALGSAVIAVAVFRGRTQTRKRLLLLERAFAGRPSLTPDEFHQLYFAGSNVPREITTAIPSILGDVLLFDPARLQPDDDFLNNLRFIWSGVDEWADVDIVVQIEEHFGIQISDSEAASCTRVSDLINLVTVKVTSKA